jgi:hypothetical protein
MLAQARYFTFAILGLVAAGVIALIVVSGGSESGGAGSGDDRCDSARNWSSAGGSIGEEATLRGPVVNAEFRPDVSGRPTFLDVGKRYPSPDRLVVIVWGRNRDAFPQSPESLYRGKTIAVTGDVTKSGGRAQVEAGAVGDVAVC